MGLAAGGGLTLILAIGAILFILGRANRPQQPNTGSGLPPVPGYAPPGVPAGVSAPAGWNQAVPPAALRNVVGNSTQHDYAGWHSYTLDGMGFEVRFPSVPEVSPIKSNGILIHLAAIKRQSEEELAYICQWHVADTPVEGEAAVMAFLTGYQGGMMRQINGTLVKDQFIESGGIAGREFFIQVSAGNLACCRRFFTGTQLVSLQVWGKDDEAVHSDDALKFLDSFGSATSKPNDEPYLTRRAQFHTTLLQRGPSPQPWSDEEPPAGVSVVEYESNGNRLKAWLSIPKLDANERRPALVYMHGGFAFAAEDFTVCQSFIDARYVVLCPTFRAENGNPGDFEMNFGEVDDAAAAIRWIAEQPYTNRERIYSFGHSAGGAISAVLSLYEDVPLRYGGSACGIYGKDLFFFPSEPVPFDRANDVECQLRILLGNVRWMNRPHFAFVGTQDVFMKGGEARQEAVESHSPLDVIDVDGDHQSMLAPSIRQFLTITERDG